MTESNDDFARRMREKRGQRGQPPLRGEVYYVRMWRGYHEAVPRDILAKIPPGSGGLYAEVCNDMGFPVESLSPLVAPPNSVADVEDMQVSEAGPNFGRVRFKAGVVPLSWQLHSAVSKDRVIDSAAIDLAEQLGEHEEAKREVMEKTIRDFTEYYGSPREAMPEEFDGLAKLLADGAAK